jgi:hypothetical protein
MTDARFATRGRRLLLSPAGGNGWITHDPTGGGQMAGMEEPRRIEVQSGSARGQQPLRAGGELDRGQSSGHVEGRSFPGKHVTASSTGADR